MVELLKKWNLRNTSPAFNDLESATTIEMVAKLHGKMNELIESYNSFVENVNKIVEDFKTSTTKDLKEFEVSLRQEFQDFIDVINLKILSQDQLIEEAVNYMKNNIETTTNNIVNKAITDGRIIVNTSYDELTENLNIVGLPANSENI